MSCFSIATPGIVTAFAGVGNEEGFTIDVLGPRRILHTSELYCHGREGEEFSAKRPLSWDVVVPDTALVFGTTCAVAAGLSRQRWVGWLCGHALHMRALVKVRPVDAELAPDETPILPAITEPSGAATLYTWRPAERGTVLWRRSFAGDRTSAGGSPCAEPLSVVPGRPSLSAVGTIPGEERQHVVIGWVESSRQGAVVGIAVVTPEHMHVVRSYPILGVAPFPRQRLGIWAGAGASDPRGVQVTAMLASHAEKASYRVAVLAPAGTADQTPLALSDTLLPPGALYAAAFDYLKNPAEPHGCRVFLTHDGTVMNERQLRMHHAHGADYGYRHVGLDNPLPVMTSGKRLYWGSRNPDGTMSFEPFW